MFGRNQDMLVYLFCGLLESGKTTCIKEIIEEGNFNDGKRTLLILCEEGEYEIPDKLLKDNGMSCVVIEDEEEFTEDLCKSFVKKYKPDRILIEFNGMWSMSNLINEVLPENWAVVQAFCTVNAKTFEMYNNNMKALMIEHYKIADLVIFNRCDEVGESFNKGAARRTVKAVNRASQVMFEGKDGIVDNNIADELPYDINADNIVLEDDDFGLWYLDISENPRRYEGKTISFKGQVYRNLSFPKDAFVPSRRAMTCCVDDISRIGFMCHYDKAKDFPSNSWVYVTVKPEFKRSRQRDGEYPVLYASSVEKTEAPEEEVVYFS